MKLFIWESVDNITGSYHNGGGVAVCAATLERARELVPREADDDSGKCADIPEPSHIYDLSGEYDEKAWIFPDAGCC